jgi:hypothetical protein
MISKDPFFWPTLGLMFISLSVVGCSHPQKATQLGDHTTTHSLSSEQVTAEAMKEAGTAISSGNLYLCETGTIGIYTPGVPETTKELVRDLPRHRLPSGCLEPHVWRSIAYAQVFNGEIIQFLANKKPKSSSQ